MDKVQKYNSFNTNIDLCCIFQSFVSCLFYVICSSSSSDNNSHNNEKDSCFRA
jgi:hypothetical protein